MKIVTLTLNPAFDVHCFIKAFAPYHENLASITENEAGGKGVNISRALTSCGVENLAFVVLGEENGESFVKRLEADGMKYRAISVSGRIRENITVHTDNAPETRISFEGFVAPADLLDQVSKALDGEIDSDTVITFTGRNPSGIGMSETQEFIRKAKDKGAKIVIDSRSFSLDDLKAARPWLIKPNQEEISQYLGREIETFDEVISAAKELYEEGIENVMISLGGRGALLVCADGVFLATPPQIDVKSTIGAGDSSIGGFLAAAKCGASAEDRLRYATAYGTAACMTEGTRPPQKEDVTSLLNEIKTKKI